MDEPIVKLLPTDGASSPPPPKPTSRLETMTITVEEFPDGTTGSVKVNGPRDNGIAFKLLELARTVIVKRVLQDANLLPGDGRLLKVDDGR